MTWKRLATKGLAQALAVVCAINLSACGNSDISKLKAQTLDANPSFTIGQAFDHRKACDSVSWKENTDDRGRKIIEYHCIFNIDKSYYEKAQQAHIDKLNQLMRGEQAAYQADLESKPKSIAIEEKLLSDPTINTPHGPYMPNFEQDKQNLVKMKADYQAALANQSQALANIQKNYDDQIAKIKTDGVVSGGIEVFQWVVNDDGFTPIYAGRDIQVSNGNVIHQNYSEANVEHALAAMVRNDTGDLHTYMSEVTWPY